ncbi:ATP-binding protein [Nocardioides sp. KC13]|uniref:ATP-binding protein n=1 Tax=Nocardioides turkmenicus TaxID=2711220 RepID=A0A6M1R321_9ACTN|nr:AAA family ATPase [Nocardioides sp. KC13]NGN94310.1 ATP-binding protein [Nocardioides sp. KC13]
MNAISPSEINDLLNRVRRRSYRNYLLSMDLKKIRGFRDAHVRFDFPVTALVGPNGAGKTTVLGAAGLIYADVQPRRFFARGGTYDSSMSGWKVEYEVYSGGTSVPRTASYTDATADVTRSKWNRKGVARPVKVIGVNRTLPLTERNDVQRFAKGDFIGVTEESFTQEVVSAVERILGKKAADYLQVHADENGKYSILALKPSSADTPGYSEFHFGAGEASIIRIVSEIESVEDQALILIEEVENGLHPIATRRLVEYLIAVCRRKGCQVIFTTHSNAALSPLPGEAVWSSYGGKLTQGKLDVESLRALTGEIDARLAVFAEDNFGSLVAEVTLRRFGDLTDRRIDIKGVEIHALGGAAQARDQARHNNRSPARRFKALSFLDGDKRAQLDYNPRSRDDLNVDGSPFVTFFTGTSDPEAVIVEQLAELIETNGRVLPRLTLALQMDTRHENEVGEVLKTRLLTNTDRHEIFKEIGEDLDFLGQEVTARAFVSTWANFNDDAVKSIWEPVVDHLPLLSDPT